MEAIREGCVCAGGRGSEEVNGGLRGLIGGLCGVVAASAAGAGVVCCFVAVDGVPRDGAELDAE